MAIHTQILRSLLLGTLLTTVGCGKEDPKVTTTTDITIGGRTLHVIPTREPGFFYGTNTYYTICIPPGEEDCYTLKGYKAKMNREIDQALGE